MAGIRLYVGETYVLHVALLESCLYLRQHFRFYDVVGEMRWRFSR